MKILRVIGAFFAKIGRWIKDTAWVQPLLIVGGIFAIIFSIKPISDAISNMFTGGVASEDYYNSYRLSLKGAENGTSDADKLFNAIEKHDLEGYESKFYVSFVSKNCSNCDACYMGFKVFQENFNKSSAFKIENDYLGDGFKLYTIFCDEKNDNDKLLIDDFLRNHADYFQTLFGFVNEMIDRENYNYYCNTSDKATFKANVKSFYDCINADEEEDNVSMPTPTTLLFDKNPSADQFHGYCSQLFFNYTIDVEGGDDGYSKAYFLRDSWNYTGKFSDEKK